MTRIKGAIFGLAMLGMAATVQANLILNGSFEEPNLNGGWGTFNSILGWARQGTELIEIGHGSIYGISNYHLNQVMEMDSYGNSIVQQVLGTSTGESYKLSFGVARRSGYSVETCQVEVWWNGLKLDTIAPPDTAMQYYTYDVLGGASGSTLEFRGAGTSETYGGLIDNVTLLESPQAVPEPFTVGLMASAAVLGYRRVNRKRAGAVA